MSVFKTKEITVKRMASCFIVAACLGAFFSAGCAFAGSNIELGDPNQVNSESAWKAPALAAAKETAGSHLLINFAENVSGVTHVTLWALDTGTGDSHRIVNHTTFAPLNGLFAISPDCGKVFMNEIVDRQKHDIQLTLMGIDGSNPIKVADGSKYVLWSPDGKEAAYYNGDTRPGAPNRQPAPLDIIAADGHRLDSYPVPPSSNYFVWSPDGSTIAFTAQDAGNFAITYRIYLLNVKNGETRQIDSTAAQMISDLAWSPDSRRLAYKQSDKQIDYIDLTTEKVGTIYTPPFDASPDSLMLNDGEGLAWSPDGGFIAFTLTTDPELAQQHSQLWFVNANGSNPQMQFEDDGVFQVMGWCHCRSLPQTIEMHS